jgi:hypothetical protein
MRLVVEVGGMERVDEILLVVEVIKLEEETLDEVVVDVVTGALLVEARVLVVIRLVVETIAVVVEGFTVVVDVEGLALVLETVVLLVEGRTEAEEVDTLVELEMEVALVDARMLVKVVVEATGTGLV